MARVVEVHGIDPGLVDIGFVRAVFDREQRLLELWGRKFPAASKENLLFFVQGTPPDRTFIEDFRVRSGFSQNNEMIEQVAWLKNATHNGVALDNMGVKQIVRRPLMEMLDMWNWRVSSHHADIRSAARILLYGMLKDLEMNALLSDIVRDIFDQGRPWTINHF